MGRGGLDLTLGFWSVRSESTLGNGLAPDVGPRKTRKFSVRSSETNLGASCEAIEFQRAADSGHSAPGGGRGGRRGGVPEGRDFPADPLPLWTALLLQGMLIRAAWVSCKHLSGITRIGVSEWAIRTHPPLQLVGLGGLDSSQDRGARIRPVLLISSASRNLVAGSQPAARTPNIFPGAAARTP